ncbi:hypothetical protein C2869_03755 [Saccharobesus litoralis]|uniref:Uncharacterized protein n=1 Tax=Saccharobesus litoralis TaxID=2172099 RepID=A0A2S0VN10_9ALTE|nr:hypothetical protein [Saccharobesus litoralis]AWB65604.1 hypothetical protein C2869_03755 [Saccharobesus litoralis]
MTKPKQNQATKEQYQEHAKQQLLDALLHHTYQDKQQAKQQNEDRIAKVMAAIDSQATEQLDSTNDTRERPHSNVFTLPFGKNSWMGLAASVCLFVVTLSFWLLPANTAIAEVKNLIEYLEHLSDRLYQVHVEAIENKQNLSPEQLALKQKKQQLKQDRQSDKPSKTLIKPAAQWLDGAQLYMRGSDQYLLVAQTEKGQLLRGRNQDTSWKLDHKNQIKHYSDFSKIKLPFAGDAVNMAFMDLPLLLVTLTEKYQLTYQADAHTNIQTSELANSKLSLIIADKKDQQKGVKQVLIYYQADSYQIEKIVFNRVHMQGSDQRYQVSLQRVETEALAEEFFSPEYH